MKILTLSNFIYDVDQKVFCKNACGFGIMVNDIVNSVSVYDEVYLLTRAFHYKRKVNAYVLLTHMPHNIMRSVSISGVGRAISAFTECRDSIRMKLRYAYYVLDTECVRKIISEIKPDVVHVHGLSYSTKQYINLLRDMDIPFVVTLHGLIGLDDSVSASFHDKKYEKEFLQLSEKEHIPITVISTGMKERIKQYYQVSGNNIYVVLNGISIEKKYYSTEDINEFKKKLGVADKKIIITVGNITKNKNQEQLIDALVLLKEETRKKIIVLLAGKDVLHGILKEKVEKYGLSDVVSFLGFLSRDELYKIYEISDVNVFTSLNDGFGLPIIEGYFHGLPVVTYSDLDAYTDVYHAKCMISLTNRTNKALAEGIELALTHPWDRESIQKNSEKYSLDEMARKYHTIYEITKRTQGKYEKIK